MFDLSPWLQLPIVLAVVLPAAGAAAAAVLWLVDKLCAGTRGRGMIPDHG